MNLKQAVVGILAAGCVIGTAMLLPRAGYAEDDITGKVNAGMTKLQDGAKKLGAAKVEGTEDLAGLAAALFADESNRPGRAPSCRLAIVANSVEDLRQKAHKAATLLAERAELNDPSGIYCSEAAPVVLIRGLRWSAPESTAASLIRPSNEDLFR